MVAFFKWVVSSFSIKDRTAVIASAITDGKVTKDEQKTLIAGALKNIPNLDVNAVTSEVFKGQNKETQKKILADILQIAIAGGEGYLTGGDAGAGLAAANTLVGILNKQ